MYYTQKQIDRANQTDIAVFLWAQGEQLEHSGQEYRWKRHDSLTVRGNKWFRHSQSKGGYPVDFVMEFFCKSFTEAVALLIGDSAYSPPKTEPQFRLPPRNDDNFIVKKHLTEVRRIDEDVVDFFFSSGDVYEDAAHHNAVFVGRDAAGIPCFAHKRSTTDNYRSDVTRFQQGLWLCLSRQRRHAVRI